MTFQTLIGNSKTMPATETIENMWQFQTLIGNSKTVPPAQPAQHGFRQFQTLIGNSKTDGKLHYIPRM